MQDTIIQNTIEYIDTLFRGNAGGHDAAHTMRVYRNAMLIAETEPECDVRRVALAALLHDADDHKLFGGTDSRGPKPLSATNPRGAKPSNRENASGGQESGNEAVRSAGPIPTGETNRHARAFLTEQHVSADEIDEICRIVNSVSFSRNKGKCPDTLEGRIVQDADRLDAMGAVGIARTFAYGGEHGRPLEESIQHFHDKLLRLNALMNTAKGREMAARRHAFLERFLEEYQEEEAELSGEE